MMLFLTFATIALFAFLRTGVNLSKSKSWALLVIYAVFIAWMILETFGVMGLVT